MHTHVGSYDALGGLLSHLHSRIVPERALCVDYDRPFMTVHLNDPAVTREVHRRTELCVPVVPIAMPLPRNDAGRQVPDTRPIARRSPGRARSHPQ